MMLATEGRVGWIFRYAYLWDWTIIGAARRRGLRTGLARWSPRPDGMETALSRSSFR